MVTFHCLRSEAGNPLACIRRICFKTVDFPDSPAPVMSCQCLLLVDWVTTILRYAPSSSILTSLDCRLWSALSCFSISAFFLASGSCCLLLPKHITPIDPN